ncbi:hypothetical protein [Streptomyces sp. PR69]|uniref:hypothetical protein n=1 Tax=Streptomyces sp. PR69 TaxID=2984950 RepID=UPI002263DBE3|nr:hypothetical protein [Streptomyces sp. PR69]
MISRARKLLVAGSVGTLVAISGAAAISSASAAPRNAPAAQAEGEIPPFAVEDFNYPDADGILAEKGIKLHRGDGHILLADCDASANQIQVWTRHNKEEGMYCFNATASTGYLTLEVPDVFAIQTSDHPVTAELTAEGKKETVAVAKDDFKGVGEGVGGAPTVLVELRVTG